MQDHDRAQWFETLRANANASEKSWRTTFALSVSLGFLGVDLFYLGYVGLALCKLFTLGFGGLWWVLDIVLLLLNQTRDADGRIVRRPF